MALKPDHAHLEELVKKSSELHATKIRAEAELERAERDLNEARQQMKEQYGVDDEDQLRELVMKVKREDAEALQSFSDNLKAIEDRLALIK